MKGCKGMRSLRAMAGRLAVALCAAIVLAATAEAQTPEPDRERCAAVRDLYLRDTAILSAAPAAASGDLPAFCRVVGTVRPAITFELRLPVEGWNGKLYMAGCGGFCGGLDADLPGFVNAMNFGLRRGYAAATTDAGHWGDGRASGLWGYGNHQAEIDWGSRAVGEVATVAKAVVAAYYGQPSRHAYFAGCGTGGRLGAMAALRFPDAFDGIVSGAPFLRQADVMGVLYASQAQAVTDDEGQTILDPAAVDTLADAVTAFCDKADGLVDGIVGAPAACAFDPRTLLCPKVGSSDSACLSAEQVEAAQRLYEGARDGAGERLTYGLPLGSERYWPLWVSGDSERIGANLLFNREFLRYLAYDPDPGETYDPMIFDFDQDPPALEAARQTYDVTEANLAAFHNNGGKMLIYHGLADAAVPAQYSIDFYEEAQTALGGPETAQESIRLFLVPGMDHCGLQPGLGPDRFDPLAALEAWVENGEAPTRILAEQRDAEGAVTRSRPLCVYPQAAVLRRGGDADTAEGFECTTP